MDHFFLDFSANVQSKLHYLRLRSELSGTIRDQASAVRCRTSQQTVPRLYCVPCRMIDVRWACCRGHSWLEFVDKSFFFFSKNNNNAKPTDSVSGRSLMGFVLGPDSFLFSLSSHSFNDIRKETQVLARAGMTGASCVSIMQPAKRGEKRALKGTKRLCMHCGRAASVRHRRQKDKTYYGILW